MNNPQLERMEIFRQVRVVLVRHMIDIGRLSIQISMSRVNLHGSLCRLPGVTTELTPAIIRTMFSELNLIKGVKRVDAEFDNWKQLDALGAAWARIEAKKLIQTPPPGAGAEGEAIDVSDADVSDQPPK